MIFFFKNLYDGSIGSYIQDQSLKKQNILCRLFNVKLLTNNMINVLFFFLTFETIASDLKTQILIFQQFIIVRYDFLFFHYLNK